MRLIVDSHVTVGNNAEIPGPLCPVSRRGNCGTIPHQDTDIGKVKVEKDSIPRGPSCLPVTATPASLPPVSSSTPDSYSPVLHLSDFVSARMLCTWNHTVCHLQGLASFTERKSLESSRWLLFIAKSVSMVWLHHSLTFRPFTGLYVISSVGLLGMKLLRPLVYRGLCECSFHFSGRHSWGCRG